MNFTNGKRVTEAEPYYLYPVWANDLRRIYDRLRKRSYRDLKHFAAWMWGDIGSDDFSLEYEEEFPNHRKWAVCQHEAYVQGVRDALNEINNG